MGTKIRIICQWANGAMDKFVHSIKQEIILIIKIFFIHLLRVTKKAIGTNFYREYGQNDFAI
ncbi:hypothetical protein HMPREF1551_02303 [Capnocytophaga sp. oral taxon 863 str. F0517]|nr:hypothetical protein HMPREF1551_02303 [Capnocytophaga sp. oral taxon 863 str. F0517]